MKNVLTVGTFDCPHIGHALFLSKCAEFGDTLIIGVNTDEFVEKYKGKKPLFSFEERRNLLQPFAALTVANDTYSDFITMVEEYEIEVVVVGSDWYEKDYAAQTGLTQEVLKKHNVSLVFVPYTEEISTTLIKERIKNG